MKKKLLCAMKSAIAGYFSLKSKYSQESLDNKCVKINILPIYINDENYTIATLKFPFNSDEIYDYNESPLANVKLPTKRFEKKKEKTLYDSRVIIGPNDYENNNKKTKSPAILRKSSLDSYYDETKHKYCRNQKYPNSNIDRYPVPDDKIKFNISYKEYDNDLIPFIRNFCDQKKSLERLSYTEYNEAINNKLKNPIGRTGMIGKGLLKHFGPNRYAFLLITKYKRTNADTVQMRKNENNPSYQFLAFKYKDFDGQKAIINGTFENDGYYLHGFPKPISKKVIKSKFKIDYLHKFYLKLFINPLTVYNGYLDDYLNTDDAWIDAIAENYHHESDDVPLDFSEALLDTEMNPDNIKLEWVDFNDETVYPPHKIILHYAKKNLDLDWYNKNL